MKWTVMLICSFVAGSMPFAMAEEADTPQIELMWFPLPQSQPEWLSAAIRMLGARVETQSAITMPCWSGSEC